MRRLPVRILLLSFVCCVLSAWLSFVLYVTFQLGSSGTVTALLDSITPNTKSLDSITPYTEFADSITNARRFPKYGTIEFASQCAWSLPRADSQDNNCTLLATPVVNASEGMADWISVAIMGFFMAKQAGCHYLLDYGPDIDISQVLTPRHPEDRLYNWTVPTGFKCSIENRCDRITHGYRFDGSAGSKGLSKLIPRGSSLVGVPYYRLGYLMGVDNIRKMQRLWPDFKMETGAACALENILQLSPLASELEPQLFSKLLPTLRDPDSLVISIYIRTGATDTKNHTEHASLFDIKRPANKGHLDCALQLEQQYLSTGNFSGALFSFSRIVWMLITDSPVLKQQVLEAYDKQDANAHVPVEVRRWKDKEVPREVLTTRARGKHTKTRRNPSTADFAEAFLDWYLIGESDHVILTQGYSFGATGAIRTARRVYEKGRCEEIFLKERE